jgi:hypothetical protein
MTHLLLLIGAAIVGTFALAVFASEAGQADATRCPACCRTVWSTRWWGRKRRWPTECRCGNRVDTEAWRAYWDGVCRDANVRP